MLRQNDILQADEVRPVDQRNPEIERLIRELSRIFAHAEQLNGELQEALAASDYTQRQKAGVLKVVRSFWLPQ